MSQQIDNTASIIQTFVNAHTETSGNMEACEKIFSDSIQNNLPSFIKNCTQILIIGPEMDDNVKKAKEMSINFLVDILDFKLNTGITQALTADDLTEQIKNAIKQNIFSDVEAIRTKSIQCYALLFIRLGLKWMDGIDEVVTSFSNPSFMPNGTIVFFSIMSEITKGENFDTAIFPSCSAQFTQTFVNALWVLAKETTDESMTPELRTAAAKYVYNIISASPQILNDNGMEGARIPLLLESIPNSFQIKNVELFQAIHQIFYTLVEKFYSISRGFIETINVFVMNGLQLQNEPKYTNASIYFWKEVAIIEHKIIEKKNLGQKNSIEPLKPLLIESALPTLLPLFIGYMRSIDENDTDVENIDEKPEPSMYATVAISEIYKIFPIEIFNMLKDNIEECINMDKWTDVHAAIQMIYSISDQPTNDCVGQFIGQNFEKLIELSAPNQVPRMRETVLFLIGLAIMNYPQIISQAGEYADRRITAILTTFESTLNLDQESIKNLSYGNTQIFVRYTSIIYHLSSAWKNNIYESHLSSFFDKLYEIDGILFNYGILSESKLLIQNSSEALNQLIFNSTPDCVSKFDFIYANKLEQITKTKELTCKEEIRDLAQSSFISHLSTLLLKLRRNSRSGIDIIGKYAYQTLECLFEILDTNKSSCVYEEGLMAISAIVSATCSKDNYIEVFNPDTFNKLVTVYVQAGLSSVNEGVINATCLLVGNLFYFLSTKIPDLNQFIPAIFSTMAKTLLDNKNQKRDCHPFLFKAISDMFNSVDQAVLQVYNLEEPLRELLTSYYDVSTTLDILKTTDVEYGNLLYQYLTDAFGSYAKVFYNTTDAQIERNQLFLLDKLANYIYKLNPKIDDNLYMSFGNTARQFASNCSRRNNVILNRHSIHRILKLGVDNCKTCELKRKLKETIEYLKSK